MDIIGKSSETCASVGFKSNWKVWLCSWVEDSGIGVPGSPKPKGEDSTAYCTSIFSDYCSFTMRITSVFWITVSLWPGLMRRCVVWFPLSVLEVISKVRQFQHIREESLQKLLQGGFVLLRNRVWVSKCSTLSYFKYILSGQVLCLHSKPWIYCVVRSCVSKANPNYIVLLGPVSPKQNIIILCFRVLCLHSKSLTYCVVRSFGPKANHEYIVLSGSFPPPHILNMLCCQVLCLHSKSLTYCVVRSCASTSNL